MAERYHHGNLRRALLDLAAELVGRDGPDALSLRELARGVGVSHAAPAHHFGDREGLFTALAAEGLQMLTAAITAATSRGFDEAAVAYVAFALEHPGHYDVMFRSDLVREADPELAAARAASASALQAGVASLAPNQRPGLSDADAAHIAWALVHGLVELMPRPAPPQPERDRMVRTAARQLFRATAPER